jgi:anti-anti-sigma factor
MAQFVARAPHDGVGSLAISGEVDIAAVETLLAQARASLDSSATGLELDLGELTFIDSSGLGALVRLRNEAARSGKSVVLRNVPAATVRLLELTGLTDAFPSTAGD